MALIAIALTFTRSVHAAEQITLQEKTLTKLNPTNYEFKASLSDVKSAIKKSFEDWRETQTKQYKAAVWNGKGNATSKHLLTLALQSSGLTHLMGKGDGDALAKNLLTKSGNENDAYIYGGESPIGASLVYFKDGQPLIYYADFHVHLESVSPKKTLVGIHTYSSSVVVDVDERWSAHGAAFISVSVKPTTIEQYQILLGIGAQLGAKGMPPLMIPAPDAPLKDLILPRER